MTIIQSAILGIVQGLGEFLPISSTAHLAIAPYFFHWNDPGLGFDVALHVGTLIALLLFFWKDWVEIIFNFQFSIFNKFSKSKKIENNKYAKNPNLLLYLAIATIPGAIFGFLLESKAETVFRNPLLIAGTLSIMGLILFLVDRYASKIKDINKITVKDSILIGLSQAIAIIPGVSRSGATITAGRALGINRIDAARFSFLLSAPIIFGAAMVKLPKMFHEGIDLNIIIGIIFSALSGYLAIKYLLKFLEKYSYAVFFWYRLALALIIVSFYFFK